MKEYIIKNVDTSMSLEEALDGFVVDEKKFKEEDIPRIINQLKKYAILIGKKGEVKIINKKLKGTDRLKIILVARYLGEQLSKIKEDIDIKKEVNINELSEMMSLDKPNIRARMSQLVSDGFAKRAEKGQICITPYYVERYLDDIDSRIDGKSVPIPSPKRVGKRKIRIPVKDSEIVNVNDDEIIKRLNNWLNIDESKLKDCIFIKPDGSFKFNVSIDGNKLKDKQKKIVLLTGFVYQYGFQKSTFASRDVSNVCRDSHISIDELREAVRSLRKEGYITKSARGSQDNRLRAKGEEEAKRIFSEF